MRKKDTENDHKKFDSAIKELLTRHTMIGDHKTKAFAVKIGIIHQRNDLEIDTKIALYVFLQLLHNHAIGFPQIMTLIESEDPSLKKFLFDSITDESILDKLDPLYDELEEITGNRAFR